MDFKKNRFAIFFTLAYAALVGFVAFYHEPWRDEAQAWLIARDLSPIGIFQMMPYNATPALWHMLLFPFAKLGAPYWSAAVIHLALAISAVYLFLTYAPFPRITKVLFIFSYYMAYEYAIIFRNYNVAILILFIIATFYDQRLSRPLRHACLVFLLANSNFFGFIIALNLSLIFLLELLIKKSKARFASTAFLIMLLGSVIALIQMLPAPDSRHFHFLGLAYQERFWFALKEAFFPKELVYMFPDGVITVFVLVLLVMATVLLIRRPGIALFMLGCYAMLFYFTIHLAIRPTLTRHHGFLMIILVFCLWVGKIGIDKNRIVSRDRLVFMLLNLCWFFSVVFSMQMLFREVKEPFSNAKEMARFISHSHLDNETIAAFQSPQALALLPYVPGTRFWYADIKDFGTFVIFNNAHEQGRKIDYLEAIARARAAFPGATILYLLTCPVENPQGQGLKLLYEASKNNLGGGHDEKYYLYR